MSQSETYSRCRSQENLKLVPVDAGQDAGKQARENIRQDSCLVAKNRFTMIGWKKKQVALMG